MSVKGLRQIQIMEDQILIGVFYLRSDFKIVQWCVSKNAIGCQILQRKFACKAFITYISCSCNASFHDCQSVHCSRVSSQPINMVDSTFQLSQATSTIAQYVRRVLLLTEVCVYHNNSHPFVVTRV